MKSLHTTSPKWLQHRQLDQGFLLSLPKSWEALDTHPKNRQKAINELMVKHRDIYSSPELTVAQVKQVYDVLIRQWNANRVYFAAIQAISEIQQKIRRPLYFTSLLVSVNRVPDVTGSLADEMFSMPQSGSGTGMKVMELPYGFAFYKSTLQENTFGELHRMLQTTQFFIPSRCDNRLFALTFSTDSIDNPKNEDIFRIIAGSFTILHPDAT